MTICILTSRRISEFLNTLRVAIADPANTDPAIPGTSTDTKAATNGHATENEGCGDMSLDIVKVSLELTMGNLRRIILA